jgi:ABC-2 type transport system permease protein
MGKTWIIISREYISRIKNRTFIIMCFVLPLMIGALFYFTQKIEDEAKGPRTIVIVDETPLSDSLSFANEFWDTLNQNIDLHFNFRHLREPLDDVKKMYHDSSSVSVLYIPSNFAGVNIDENNHSVGIKTVLKSTTEPGNDVINYLSKVLSNAWQKDKMRSEHIPQHAIDIALQKVEVADEVNGSTEGQVKGIVGIVFGLIIYMYILMFGVQIMRSVVEEKMTRIVEVIVSSVKPFQLMLGKIIGVTLVGLTQFVIWIILSLFIIVPFVNSVHNQDLDFSKTQPHSLTQAVPVQDDHSANFSIDPTQKTREIVQTFLSIPWGNLIPAFLLYFLFGYFLYASIFAAIGSAADVDADTQQFTLPVTIPLIISMASAGVVLNDPNGHLAKLLSMIPFTSPIVMLMRIPFSTPESGVSIAELLTSLGILIVTFLCFTWIAGRIYRVGILMYGKKSSWKELGKWIFYKA